MKKNKIGWILLAILVLGLASFGVYYYAFKNNSETTLTLKEKQWIENNKNKVFDFWVVTDIPAFNYHGEGVFFDFFDALEKNIHLEFNKVPSTYQSEEISNYAFQIKEAVGENDLLIYEDPYSLLTKKEATYDSIADLDGLTIGVSTSDLEKAQEFVKEVQVTFQTFDSRALLFEEMEKEDTTLDGILVPTLVYLKEEIEKENIHIAFHLEGLSEKYVLTFGETKELNTILKKYYAKWAKENFETSFQNHFLKEYFTFAQVEEKDQVDFKSKRYTYGFIENRPYDTVKGNKLAGINSEVLKSFANLSNIEIAYQKFDTMESLLQALNENKIDFIYGMNSNKEYATDMVTTVPVIPNEIVILGNMNNDISVSSVASLKGTTVGVLKDTELGAYLKEFGVDVKEYHTLKSLFRNKSKAGILAIDSKTYEYYSRTELKSYFPLYRFFMEESYGYVIRDIKGNRVFAKLLDFYISFMNTNRYVNVSYESLLDFRSGLNILLTIFAPILLGLLTLFGVFGLYKYIHTGKKTMHFTKPDRIKYIDQLTSLKNRNYLNDNIEKWDASEVYPQSIVIVDLNNIAYINDNYGHQEGDNVITEAANILIKSQIENSDIIRTNGNEFLIYLVGYDEKQIIAYRRKLSKDLKELAHGFGAAVGYSMITDAIKTIDDAVNEATLDMRARKEERENED